MNKRAVVDRIIESLDPIEDMGFSDYRNAVMNIVAGLNDIRKAKDMISKAFSRKLIKGYLDIEDTADRKLSSLVDEFAGSMEEVDDTFESLDKYVERVLMKELAKGR